VKKLNADKKFIINFTLILKRIGKTFKFVKWSEWFNGINLQMFSKQKTFFIKTRFFLLVFFIIGITTVVFSQPNKYYTVNAKFKMEGSGDYKDAYMVMQKNGVAITTLPGQSSYKIDLEYGGDYILSFSKPGYITKKININTVVEDEERKSQGFESYPFTVVLIKQYNDVNTVVFNQPVAKIMYSKKFDDFDYDTDYTKSIQSAIKKAEDELKQKEKEAKANPPKPLVDSTAIFAQAKKAEELKAKEEARKIAEEEKKKLAEEKAAKKKEEMEQAAAEKVKEKEDAEVRKQKEKEEADAKKRADEMAAEDSRKAAEEKAAEVRRKKASESGGEDAKKTASSGSGEDNPKGTVAASAGEDGNKDIAASGGNDGVKPNVKLSGGSDKKENKVADEKTNDVVPEKIIEKPAQTEVIKSAPEKVDDNITINREEINEDKKTISHIWVTKGDKTVLYSRVKYAWGGIFYFREMKISISENMFKLADAGKVNF